VTYSIPIPQAATLADCLGAGLFLIDYTGRIIHANASVHAMLHQRTVVRVAGGKLVA
jgi:PAS domain-containing protein